MLRIEESTYDKISELAEQQQRSIAGQIRFMLDQAIVEQ